MLLLKFVSIELYQNELFYAMNEFADCIEHLGNVTRSE